MAKFEKLIRKILSGQSDANIKFNDVVRLLKHLGFEMRTKGSHNIFSKDGVNELINIAVFKSLMQQRGILRFVE